MKITLKEAAYMLNTSEEMLLRWIEQGVIQSTKLNNEMFLERKTLCDWAAKRRMPVRENIELCTCSIPDDDMSLTAAVKRGGVHFQVEGNNVAEVLKSCIEKTYLPSQLDKSDLLAKLMAREESASTGIGNGIALPHPGRPLLNIHEGGVISVCFLAKPVDFNAIDKQPVRLVFTVFCSSSRRHLELLSKLSFCLSNQTFLEKLFELKNESEVICALKEADQELFDDNF